MGKCQSANKNRFNSSFPDNYILTDTEEYSIDENNINLNV